MNLALAATALPHFDVAAYLLLPVTKYLVTTPPIIFKTL
jgi:hypothetical protein